MSDAPARSEQALDEPGRGTPGAGLAAPLLLLRGPGAPAAARSALASVDALIGASHAYTAQLLASEIVTNAVTHGQVGATTSSVGFTFTCSSVRLRVEVADRGTGFDPMDRGGSTDTDDFHGRGLFLVDQIATRWGVEDGGRAIWFELDVEDSP